MPIPPPDGDDEARAAIVLTSPTVTPDRLARLIQLGRVEIILAGALAVLSIAVHLLVPGPWQPLLLDLCACAAAAVSGRRPRAAGAVLAAILAVYLFAPAGWQTLGEYAAFIPILGAGMRDDGRSRWLLTLAYFPLVAGITWLDAPRPASALLGCLFWAVALAVMWVIGTVFAKAVSAQRQARVADLMRQRQAVARELHDTVAASLTKLVMAAELAILRGTISPSGLRDLADSASMSIQELRWIVGLLRDPSEVNDFRLEHHTELGTALASAERELTRHGFAVTVAVAGDLGRIGHREAGGISAATVEAANNIVKHGDQNGACAILVEVGPATVEVVFVNRKLRDSVEGRPAGEQYGLVGLRERLAEIGGSVVIEDSPDQWLTRLVLPLRAPTENQDAAA